MALIFRMGGCGKKVTQGFPAYESSQTSHPPNLLVQQRWLQEEVRGEPKRGVEVGRYTDRPQACPQATRSMDQRRPPQMSIYLGQPGSLTLRLSAHQRAACGEGQRTASLLRRPGRHVRSHKLSPLTPVGTVEVSFDRWGVPLLVSAVRDGETARERRRRVVLASSGAAEHENSIPNRRANQTHALGTAYRVISLPHIFTAVSGGSLSVPRRLHESGCTSGLDYQRRQWSWYAQRSRRKTGSVQNCPLGQGQRELDPTLDSTAVRTFVFSRDI